MIVCGECRRPYGHHGAGLHADLAAANATIDAQALALATMREALEQVLTESEWVKKRNEWLSHGQTVGMQPTADRACQEIHFIARQALAQPASDAAALAGAVLEAGDELVKWCEYNAAHSPDCAVNRDDDEGCNCGRNDVIVAYRRARAALRGGGAV